MYVSTPCVFVRDMRAAHRFLGHLGTFYCRPGESLAEFWGED